MLSMPRIVRPDLFRFRGIEIGFPLDTTTHRSIKRNKELVKHLIEPIHSQARLRKSLPASAGAIESYGS
jgi:hypothetical protein